MRLTSIVLQILLSHFVFLSQVTLNTLRKINAKMTRMYKATCYIQKVELQPHGMFVIAFISCWLFRSGNKQKEKWQVEGNLANKTSSLYLNQFSEGFLKILFYSWVSCSWYISSIVYERYFFINRNKGTQSTTNKLLE